MMNQSKKVNAIKTIDTSKLVKKLTIAQKIMKFKKKKKKKKNKNKLKSSNKNLL